MSKRILEKKNSNHRLFFFLNVQDFEALQGRVNGKTAFYEALSRSLGGETGNPLLKEAATWFYSLDHSPTPQGYSLFSRSLNNATRCVAAIILNVFLQRQKDFVYPSLFV